MTGGELDALAQTAAQTLVAAATTDAWGKAKAMIAKLFGRGDPARAEASERRLEETRSWLAAAPQSEILNTRITQVAAWQVRIRDFLEENFDAEPEIQAIVAALTAELRTSPAATIIRGISAGRNITITSRGGIVAGEINGNISLPGEGNPVI